MKYQQVISGFIQDSKLGLKSLFEGYGSQLFGFSVTHFHLDEDEGYEVLYKTMETVGKVITRYEFNSETHFANWLFKIHKNNVLQLLRIKKRKEQQIQIVDFNDWKEEAKELEGEYVDLEFFRPVIGEIAQLKLYENSQKNSKLFLALQKALQEITDLERDLLLLRMNNFSYDEIAAMLGIENNQLKVKFLRAKAKVEKKTLEILNDNL
ncbi:MAG: sigma-70 family RNA polymerase sigma factor [Cyclobacteriaceae bacterium]|nr:sigma-70 family RNA polymerase sigma factor [Cyclobacteriaceae bacterium]